MGTRGAYGFRINNIDKVTYNHYDSYPDELGRNVMKYISKTPLAALKEVAAGIQLVERSSTPSQKLILKYKKYADLGVAEGKYEDWYCLLRKAQGDLFAFHRGLKHMPDYSEFLADSLFCEWAYILNLDTERLESYTGFNKNRSAKGRYASQSIERNSGYYGVALLKEIALPDITEGGIDAYVSELEKLGRYGR